MSYVVIHINDVIVFLWTKISEGRFQHLCDKETHTAKGGGGGGGGVQGVNNKLTSEFMYVKGIYTFT